MRYRFVPFYLSFKKLGRDLGTKKSDGCDISAIGQRQAKRYTTGLLNLRRNGLRPASKVQSYWSMGLIRVPACGFYDIEVNLSEQKTANCYFLNQSVDIADLVQPPPGINTNRGTF
jgi:hypothetical protein